MNYSKESLKQGRRNQDASRETMASFGLMDSATMPEENDNDLSIQNTRMAGVVGARALAMMNNPEEMQRTDEWMRKYLYGGRGQSEDGLRWRQTIMNEEPSPNSDNQ